jgi:hypothetical protein
MKLWEALKAAAEDREKVTHPQLWNDWAIKYLIISYNAQTKDYRWHDDLNNYDMAYLNILPLDGWEIYKEPLIPAQEIPDMPIYCPDDYVILNNKKYVYAK